MTANSKYIQVAGLYFSLYDSNADDRYDNNVATETALPSDDVEITGMDIVLTYTQRATTTTTTSN